MLAAGAQQCLFPGNWEFTFESQRLAGLCWVSEVVGVKARPCAERGERSRNPEGRQAAVLFSGTSAPSVQALLPRGVWLPVPPLSGPCQYWFPSPPYHFFLISACEGSGLVTKGCLSTAM